MTNEPTVLVIDDEEVIREALDMLLGSQYKLYFAENGVEGLARALQNKPDVILLDVMMPQMDGFEVSRQVRATPALAEIPIIMITALSDRDSRLQGLRAGVDDFLTKPFDSLELLARLATITRLNRYRKLIEQRDELQHAHKELEIAHQELLISYQKTIEGWVSALDLRDKETEGHTQRVTQLSVEFARAVGIDEAQLDYVRIGALLHDIGKLGVPDAILLKPGKLTEEEWVVMRKHPEYAYKWLSPIDYLRPVLDIPYCHHEKWDGKGYPDGLSGEDIPLFARLFAIVDAWDALRSNRPYRGAMSEEDVIAYLKAEAGTHFDPDLVETFISLRQAGWNPR
ncbi:MAG: HD domain-containing phosphohydrolase [Chloroflexota bacterium]